MEWWRECGSSDDASELHLRAVDALKSEMWQALSLRWTMRWFWWQGLGEAVTLSLRSQSFWLAFAAAELISAG